MRLHEQKKSKLAIALVLVSCLQTVGCRDEEPAEVAALPDTQIHRIAFGSCAMQWEDQPIWKTIGDTKPDLFLFIGDAIYGDWDGENVFDVTEETLTRDWGKLAAVPEFQEFRANIPIVATWDNHDYGKHNGGAEFPKKELTKRYFLDFFAEPDGSERRSTPGIYDATILGPEGKRVQIILLDTRYFKSPFKNDPRTKEELKAIGKVGKYLPNTDPEVTLLGETQWQWLEEQLARPAEIHFIVSSTQVIPNEKGMDEWGVFPGDRQKLFDLIRSTGANGVILLSGNVHFAELSRTSEGPYPLYDFTSSGLTHINESYGGADNSYRIGDPFVDLNFGLVEIDWEAQPAPQVTLKAIGLDGTAAFEHQVSLEELREGSE